MRTARPAEYDRIAPLVDGWWGGRQMIDMLPRLFFVHFTETAFVAEDGDDLCGFLAGFLSQSRPDEAYIHFAGVSPDHRGRGRQGADVEAPVNKRGLAPFIHSHSMVAGGFEEMSSATRFTPGISLMIRFEIRSSTS